MVWAKVVGGLGDDYAYSLLPTSDGGFLVLGSSESFGSGGLDAFLFKLDGVGNLVWAAVYGGPRDDEGYELVPTSDGGYLVVGRTESFGAGQGDLFLLKLGPGGGLAWAKTFGANQEEAGYSAVQMPDGGYAVVGYTQSYGAGQYDIFLLRLDSSGNLRWLKTYGGSNIDEAFSMSLTPDGSLVLGGFTWSFGARQNDLFVLKVDSLGNFLWSTMMGSSNGDEALSVASTSGGGLVAVGYTWDLGIGNGDFFVVKLDSLGSPQWSTAFGGGNADFAYSAVPVSDGYAVVGYTMSFGAGQKDGFILKIDSSGEYAGCVLGLLPREEHPVPEVRVPLFVSVPDAHPTLSWVNPQVRSPSVPTEDACVPLFWSVCEGAARARVSWAPAPGGVVFLSTSPLTLRVYLPDGRLVRKARLKAGKTFVKLNQGVYFWEASGESGRLVVTR